MQSKKKTLFKVSSLPTALNPKNVEKEKSSEFLKKRTIFLMQSFSLCLAIVILARIANIYSVYFCLIFFPIILIYNILVIYFRKGLGLPW